MPEGWKRVCQEGVSRGVDGVSREEELGRSLCRGCLCRGGPEKAWKGKKALATFLSSSAGPPGCGLPGIYPLAKNRDF